MFREWKDTDMSVDHKYPCIQGFLRLIEPKLIAHTDNLQLMSRSENSSKNATIIKGIIPDVLKEEVKKPIKALIGHSMFDCLSHQMLLTFLKIFET